RFRKRGKIRHDVAKIVRVLREYLVEPAQHPAGGFAHRVSRSFASIELGKLALGCIRQGRAWRSTGKGYRRDAGEALELKRDLRIRPNRRVCVDGDCSIDQ